jgi:hypothetical protein
MILSMIAVCLKNGSLSENKKMVASSQLLVKVCTKTKKVLASGVPFLSTATMLKSRPTSGTGMEQTTTLSSLESTFYSILKTLVFSLNVLHKHTVSAFMLILRSVTTSLST